MILLRFSSKDIEKRFSALFTEKLPRAVILSTPHENPIEVALGVADYKNPAVYLVDDTILKTDFLPRFFQKKEAHHQKVIFLNRSKSKREEVKKLFPDILVFSKIGDGYKSLCKNIIKYTEPIPA